MPALGAGGRQFESDLSDQLFLKEVKMGYIRDMYGDQSPDFIRGFISAIDTYAVHLNGKRWIGSPEKEAKIAMAEAIKDLGDDPKVYLDTI